MRILLSSPLFTILITQIVFSQQVNNDKRLQAYIDVLSEEGNDPIDAWKERKN